MSSFITFAADNDTFRNRKRVHKACDACRKRRKRCGHTFSEAGSGALQGKEDPRSAHPPALVPGNLAGCESTPTPVERNHGSPSPVQSDPECHAPATPPRFVGYLNPEAVLRGQVPEPGLAQSDNQCGYWVRAPGEGSSPSAISRSREASSTGRSPRSVAIDQARRAYLEAIGVHVVPPRPLQEKLLRIYFSTVQPLLPVVDQEIFEKQFREGTESRILMQAICIIASKHDQARPYLYLTDDTAPLEPRGFAKRLYTSVTAAINARLEADRVVLIRVLALLSLHSESSEEADQASIHLAEAVQQAHTIGLQFRRHGVALERLFWCLWSLDKVNGAILGRPLIIHDRDNCLESPNASTEHQKSAFGIWLKLAEALDKVIAFYRPGVDASTTGWEADFPGFEDIVGDGGEQLEGPILTTLELFYHAVAMASRKSKAISDPVRSTPSYVRQSLSAVRVITILDSESPANLPALPIVPYALSLAMSVAYRHFRQSKLQAHKNRAKEDLKRCCVLLSGLRDAWWSAGAMVDLGKAVLNNADNPSRAPKAAVPSQKDRADANGGNLALGEAHNKASVEATAHLGEGAQGFPTREPQTTSNGSALEEGVLPGVPGENPTSNEMAERSALGTIESPDWMNFDLAFDGIDTFLGSSAADLSSYELLRPFNYDGLEFLDGPTSA